MFQTPFGTNPSVLLPALILVVLIPITAIGILIITIIRADDHLPSKETKELPDEQGSNATSS